MIYWLEVDATSPSMEMDVCVHTPASPVWSLSQSWIMKQSKRCTRQSERDSDPLLQPTTLILILHCICFICMHQSPTAGHLIIRLDDDDGRNLLVELSKRRSNQIFFLTRFMPVRCHGKKNSWTKTSKTEITISAQIYFRCNTQNINQRRNKIACIC